MPFPSLARASGDCLDALNHNPKQNQQRIRAMAASGSGQTASDPKRTSADDLSSALGAA